MSAVARWRRCGAVLADDGVLAVTSRTWERLRATRPRLEVDDRLVHRQCLAPATAAA